MPSYFWYQTCPFCEQGRLVIQAVVRSSSDRLNSDSLYLHCDECERACVEPNQAENPDSVFLTLTEDFESGNPTREEIDLAGWGEFARNSFQVECKPPPGE